MVGNAAGSNARQRLLRRALSPLLLVIAVALVLGEATIWRWLTAIGRLLARLPVFAALERLVERLSPQAVVAVFVLPFVPIVPLLKLAEFWLLEHHHFISAAVLIIGAKIGGAAFSTRVFAVARPKIMQVHWFARLYVMVTRLLERGHEALRRIPGWVRIRNATRQALDHAHAAVRGLWVNLRSVPFARRSPLTRRLSAAMRRVRRWPAP